MEKEINRKNNQIEMPIKEKGEVIYSIKRNINKSILYAGVLPQWKNFLFVFTFITGIFLVISLTIFILDSFEILPNELPLIFQQKDKIWINYPKEYIISLPFIVLLFNLLLLHFKGIIYTFDKRLVTIINVGELITYLLIFLGITQLSTLLLV